MKVCFVTIIGAPNSGKSSLLNEILSYNLSIVTTRAHTTRDQITGILNEDDYQIVFTDTPGIHKTDTVFGNILNHNAFESMRGVDLVLFLTPATRLMKENDLIAINKVKNFKNKIAIITKLDLIEDKRHLLYKNLDQLREYNFDHVVSTSIKNKKSITSLINLIKTYAYEDQPYYDVNAITDKSMRFIAKEIIREVAINNLYEEIPYSISVLINKFEEDDKKNYIEATIFVKKESQKKVVIGHKGEKIKAIGEATRHKLHEIFGKPTSLYIKVATAKNWTDDEEKLKKLEYK